MPYTEIKQQKRNRGYVAPISDYQLGMMAYQAGEPITVCVTDQMARGYTRAMFCEVNA